MPAGFATKLESANEIGEEAFIMKVTWKTLRIFRNFNPAIYLLYGALFFGLRLRLVTFEVDLFDGFGCSFSDESIVKSIGGIIDALGCSGWRLGWRGRRIPLSLIFGGIATFRTAEWSGCTRFWIRFLSLFLY